MSCRLKADHAVDKDYSINGSPPAIPEQFKAKEPEPVAVANGDSAAARKRTASTADLDVPHFKKTKVDEKGTLLLDDDDDDDLIML